MESEYFDSDIEELLGPPANERLTDDRTVTTKQLADLLGATVPQVQALAREGLLKRIGTNHFNCREAVRAYCARLREKSRRGSTHPEYLAEKTRLAREQADKIAVQNAAARGELLPAAQVEAEWAAILRDVRAAMLALPSRMQQRLGHLSAHDVQTLDREIRTALRDATEIKRDESHAT